MDKIIPVVVIDDVEKTVSTLSALREGGINCAEITFRTACAKEAIKIAIAAEEKTIDFYEKLQEKLIKLEETTTIRIAMQLIAKLLADEVVHLKLLKEQINED